MAHLITISLCLNDLLPFITDATFLRRFKRLDVRRQAQALDLLVRFHLAFFGSREDEPIWLSLEEAHDCNVPDVDLGDAKQEFLTFAAGATAEKEWHDTIFS